jgi:hypothetical protein
LHLHLAPLGESEVAATAAACLGVDTAPEAILGGLRRNAAGLPLLVEDLVGERADRPLASGGHRNASSSA